MNYCTCTEEWAKLREHSRPSPQPPHLTIVLGLPGAGKSTYVKQHYPMSQQNKRLIVTFDDIRKAHGHYYAAATEPSVQSLALQMVTHGLRNGMMVVVDESVTTYSLAALLAGAAWEQRHRVKMVEVRTPLEVCAMRRIESGDITSQEYLRKVGEWLNNHKAIASLADEYVVEDGGSDASFRNL